MAFDSKILNGIVIFSEVITAGSFTKAAENSGHSASYISKEVNKLEARLGVRLLNRTTRSVSLTPEGELYFQQCQQIISTAQEATSLLSGHQLEPQGTLRINCLVSFGLSKLRPILAEFISRHPKINVELELNDKKIDMVADGFDLAIRATRVQEDSSLICRRIMTSHIVTLASPDYLSEHGTPRVIEELSSHQTISYSYLKQPEIWTYASPDGGSIDIPVKSRFISNSPEMELALCIAGQGITRLPAFNLSDELETGKLILLFPTIPKLDIGVHLVYPSRKHMSSKVRHFIDFIMQELGDGK